MENAKNITQIIIETINTILQNLFSSIDNNLYEILDDIIFINQDIISDSFFEKISLFYRKKPPLNIYVYTFITA